MLIRSKSSKEKVCHGNLIKKQKFVLKIPIFKNNFIMYWYKNYASVDIYDDLLMTLDG